MLCVRSGGGEEDGPPLGLSASALVDLACHRLLDMSAGGEIACFSPGPPQQLWWLLGDRGAISEVGGVGPGAFGFLEGLVGVRHPGSFPGSGG